MPELKKQTNVCRGSDIIEDALTSVAGVSKKTATELFNAFLESVKEMVAKGNKVSLAHFGTFEPRERKASVGRNPRTGEEVKIAAAKKVGFKPGKEFKDILNK